MRFQLGYRQRARFREALAISGCWLVALLFFFPIFWMILTSFKTELQAIAIPPKFIFAPTLEQYAEVQARSNYFHFAANSLITSLGSTLLALLIAVPSAYAMAFTGGRHTKKILLWMLSTKMLPAVGVLMPIYIIARNTGLFDSHILLILIYALINLPIVMLILYSFFREIPTEILEAGRIDGASTWSELRFMVLPLAWGGIASTALLSIVLAWNEAFWSINLTTTRATTLTAFVAQFSAPEGLFWARISAVSTLAVAPILLFGWMTQRQLVQGLTFGAVK